MIGCVHVSDLSFAAFPMPRAGMVTRGLGPDQNSELSSSLFGRPGFPSPDLIDHVSIRVGALLTSPTLKPGPAASADGALRIPVILVADDDRADHPRHLLASAMATSIFGFLANMRASQEPGRPPLRPFQ